MRGTDRWGGAVRVLDEFSMDGKVIRAEYSARSKTVYVSLIGAG
ncbi:MAG TPA: hypothetical protein VMT46_08875 [Anaerolineaceae bacterium]|nr:hypothetical protein [Anaerolineaceae bacterium]